MPYVFPPTLLHTGHCPGGGDAGGVMYVEHCQVLLPVLEAHCRWVWEKDCITAIDVPASVLQPLSYKTSGLSETTQLVLKVAACSGVINEHEIGYLSHTVLL